MDGPDDAPAPPADEADPPAVAASSPTARPGEVELALASVELSPEGLQPATGTLALVDLASGSRLDIVMARADAVLVEEAIAGTPPPRPRAHDVLLAAVAALGGEVVATTLVERRAGGVYVASIAVRRPDGSEVRLDARPSDAINVALRAGGAGLYAVPELVGVPEN